MAASVTITRAEFAFWSAGETEAKLRTAECYRTPRGLPPLTWRPKKRSMRAWLCWTAPRPITVRSLPFTFPGAVGMLEKRQWSYRWEPVDDLETGRDVKPPDGLT